MTDSYFKTYYLLSYNFFCCIGWAWIFVICVQDICTDRVLLVWDDVSAVLKVVQTAAVLEVLHSLFGIVHSSLSATFLQVLARVVYLWVVLDLIPETQHSPYTALLLTSWALVEVPRYMYYGWALIGGVPYSVFWLRYSLFLVLYVTGIAGEMGCLYVAVNALWESKGYMQVRPVPFLPDLQLNVSLLMVVMCFWLLYIPGAPKMYLHMLATRRKQFRAMRNSDAAGEKMGNRKVK